MEHYSKKRLLLNVFVDSMTGEAVGDAIGCLYAAGAKNVQVMATITKKNRPGYLFVIDCSEECADAVESVIVNEIGATGWHRVATEHCYIAVETEKLDITVSAGGVKFPVTVQRKISSAAPELIRPEYESCVELREKLKAISGKSIALPLINAKLIQAFQSKEEVPELVFED